MLRTDRLIQLRKEKGFIQQNIADYLQITRSAYVRYERGYNQPPNDALVKLADFFNVSTDYLLGKNDDCTPVQTKKETPGLITPEDVMEMAERQKGRPLTADERAELLVRANDLRATLMRIKKESE